MSFCKLTYNAYRLYILLIIANFFHFGLQSDIFCRLRHPFRDPSLKYCFSINKIEINKGIMLRMGYMVTYGLGYRSSLN